jgi:hypothetical protein
VELLKAFASRESARAAPDRERHANGMATQDVDELIASLAESVGVADPPSPPPPAPRTRSRKVRKARPRILPRIRLVSLEVVVAVALGVAIGILVTRIVS